MIHEIRARKLKQEILNVLKTKKKELGAIDLENDHFLNALIESIAVGFKRHLYSNRDQHIVRLFQFLQLLNEAPVHLTDNEETKHIYRLVMQKLAKELRLEIE